MKYVVRVDDVGQGVRQSDADRNLAAFLRWYERWRGLPLYLACVPQCFGHNEMLALRGVEPRFIALHGWNHAKEPLTPHHISKARAVFPESRVVVPPYNLYNASTLEALGDGWTLLGGFEGADHCYGKEPRYVGDCIHSCAEPALYARSWDVAKNIREGLVPRAEHPLQVVLHWRWEADHRGLELQDLIADSMVEVGALREHADRLREAGGAGSVRGGGASPVPRAAGPQTPFGS